MMKMKNLLYVNALVIKLQKILKTKPSLNRRENSLWKVTPSGADKRDL